MNDETVFTWILIAGMAVSGFLARALFILPGARFRLPHTLERILRYAPAAALMAIVVRDMAMIDGDLAISFGNARLIAGLAAFAVAIATRSVILTIACGILALTLARMMIG